MNKADPVKRMSPQETGSAYDRITHRWLSNDFNAANGIAQHERAIAFVKNKGRALDVGCGCTGRFINLLLEHGFDPEGVDVSPEKIKLARAKHPEIVFHHQDICEWSDAAKYDFITAWDSIWHVPLDKQEPLLTKLMGCLNAGGVFIFSFGATDEQNEHRDDTMGVDMYYASPGINNILKLCLQSGCICRHVEHDQHPELHAYCIVQKM